MPYFGIFDLQFWKTIVIISTLEFVKMQSFVEKNENP